MDRRLSAILAADMVAYSRLMEADEVATLARQKTHRRELIDPAMAKCHGRIVKELGDGLLIEFPSVVEAVQCAVEIQRAMPAREANIPADLQIHYRIGINLGDIIAEGEDIFGDGVNIAARMEQLAPPGGICISGTVYDQLRSTVQVGYKALGEVRVKNITRPIRAYEVLTDPARAGEVIESVPRAKALRRPVLAGLVLVTALLAVGVWWSIRLKDPPAGDAAVAAIATQDRTAIAVLPFTSLSDDPEQDYVADGMTQDLMTDLSKVSQLMVIAHNSAAAYREQSGKLSEIAQELGVQYLVTGNLRRGGGRLRINVQLLDATTGAHLWAERYDRTEADIFALQDDVLSQIVDALEVELTPAEATRISRHRTENPKAYDAYLQALRLESYFTPEANHESMAHLQRAIDLDPGFAAAIARLATAKTVAVESGWADDPLKSIEEAQDLALAAMSMDDSLPEAYWALARAQTRKEKFDGESAEAALRKAIDLDPSYADAYAFLAIVLHFLGRAEEGLGHVESAMRLNPNIPFWYYYALGANQFQLTRYEAAAVSFEKAIAKNASWRNTHFYLVSAYGHLGRIDDAEWQMEELRVLGFEPTFENFNLAHKTQVPAYRERYLEGLRKAGVPTS